MLKNLLKYKTKIVFIFIAIIGFAVIRNYEDALFYDPYLSFFKETYSSQPLPETVEWKLYLSLLMRYFLNTVISLFVLQTLFNNREFLNLAAFLYVLFFIILLILFIITIHFFKEKLMLLFYTRRFLIQPLFLLLFIPGFYFQQYSSKKTSI